MSYKHSDFTLKAKKPVSLRQLLAVHQLPQYPFQHRPFLCFVLTFDIQMLDNIGYRLGRFEISVFNHPLQYQSHVIRIDQTQIYLFHFSAVANGPIIFTSFFRIQYCLRQF